MPSARYDCKPQVRSREFRGLNEKCDFLFDARKSGEYKSHTRRRGTDSESSRCWEQRIQEPNVKVSNHNNLKPRPQGGVMTASKRPEKRLSDFNGGGVVDQDEGSD